MQNYIPTGIAAASIINWWRLEFYVVELSRNRRK